MIRTLRRAAAVSLLPLLAAGGAIAQTAPAAQTPAVQTPQLSRPGPVIAGICIMDPDRVIATSAVGRSVNTRLQQLEQQVRAELQPQQTAIQTEATQLQQQQATLTPEVRQQRATALEQRFNALQQLGAQRSRELETTQNQQLQRIAEALRPVIDQVYGQRNCGLLVNRAAIVAANPAMDISDAVIQGLNARLPSLTFNRATVPAQGAAPAAQAPAAATPPRR